MTITENLLQLGVRADEERRRRHGATTTFVRVLEVPIGAVPTAWPAGASAGEVRLSGSPTSRDEAEDAVRRAHVLANGVPLSGFDLQDLMTLAGGVENLKGLCGGLAAAGLHAVADAPIDRLDDPAAAIQAARAAGLQVYRLTVQAAGDAQQLAERARDVQSRVGGLRAFAPLPRQWSAAQPSTGYDDVTQIARSRLVVDNIPSIQVDWQRYGPKLAQVALTMGADDIDGVSPLEGELGRRRSPIEEIRGNIRAAGLDPVERNGRFEGRGQ